ncbi:MAG: protein kinase [Planctomycetes bacterium]|nr:protein kinase [Planctomycetota bacterium]
MALQTLCANPQCKNPIACPESMAGVTVRCEKCGTFNTMPEAAAQASGPRRLGRYTLVSKLGEGAMGTVYEAIQDGLGRRVAVKVMSSKWTCEPAYVARFQREARAAAALNHPHIVTVFEIGEEAGLHFFSMEFVEGESLQDRLERDRKLPVSEALDYMIQAARGLQHAWEHQIIHRDIKPGNLMVTPEKRLKITDLGLAKSVAAESVADNITSSGVVVGTLFYMSPEQAQGIKPLDFRSDIFSLGATFYHLVTGERPFTGETSLEVVMNLVKKPLRLVRSANPEVPVEVASIIQKMLAKEPADRFRSPGDLARELEAVKAQLAPARPPGSLAQPQASAAAAVEPPVDLAKADQTPRSLGLPVALLAAGIGLAILAWWGLSGSGPSGSGAGKVEPPKPSTSAASAPAAGVDHQNQKLYESALGYVQEHPEDFETGVEKLKVVEKAAERSPFGFKAMEKRMELEKTWALSVWQKLEAQAQDLAGSDRFKEAFRVIDEFPARLENVLPVEKKPDLRKTLDDRLQKRARELQAEAGQEEKVGRFAKARQCYERMRNFGVREWEETANREIEKLHQAEKRAQEDALRLREQAQKDAIQLYEKVFEEVVSMAREHRYETAVEQLQRLAASGRYQAIAQRLADDESDVRKLKQVYEAALAGLQDRIGQPYSVKGMAGTLVKLKEDQAVISVSGAEISQPVASLPVKELARLASKKLAGGDGFLSLALFWFYHGDLAEAEKALDQARDSGVDVARHRARLESARQEKDEGRASEPAREEVEQENTPGVSKEDQEEREKVVARVKAVEKRLRDENNDKFKRSAREIEERYQSANNDWKETVDRYKQWDRKEDNYYRERKREFVRAREVYDKEAYDLKKWKENTYEAIHGSALKLIRKVKAGKYMDAEDQQIEDILTGQEKLE